MEKTLLLAGGTDGIGLAFLRACLHHGDYQRVYVLGRNFSAVHALTDARILPLVCDITDTDALTRTLHSIPEPLDVFVNTIGTFQKHLVADLVPEDIRRSFELNSVANLTLTTLVLPKLRSPFAQMLVCLASLALEGRATYALQSATKASYRLFLESLRAEVGERVRVMMIHPSTVATHILQKSGHARDLSGYPQPEVIAEMMRFLLAQPPEVEIPELAVYNRHHKTPA